MNLSVIDAWIALGGNVGDVAAATDRALELLARTPGVSVVARSSLYDTTPIGVAAGDRFLNAAAGLRTSLSALDLLDRLQAIESQLGRVRTVRWGPRTIDLDLLLWGGERIRGDRLEVPHPALWRRRFVLDPLAEIAAGAVHPTCGVTIEDLRRRLLSRPLPVSVQGPADVVERCRQRAERRFPGAVRWEDPSRAALRVLVLAPQSAEAAERSSASAGAGRAPLVTLSAGNAVEELCDDILAAALDKPRRCDDDCGPGSD